MRQVQPVPCLAEAEGVSGCSPMGRQPDDLGTPAPPSARSRTTPGTKTPRTTRRYDNFRDSLDRNAAYTVAAYLA
jgi:hypothetical protein